MGNTQWKTETIEAWIKLGLPEFCQKLGISYSENFLDPIKNSTALVSPFSGLSFTWMNNSVIADGVLHLHPIQKPTTPVVWEEWFIHADGLHHHVLRNQNFAGSTDSWMGDDLDHPEQVNNVQWYLLNDADMRPTALR